MRKALEYILMPLRFLGKVMSRIITFAVLTLVYIFGIGPLAILGRILRKDFIGEKWHDANSYWLKPKKMGATLEEFKKPY